MEMHLRYMLPATMCTLITDIAVIFISSATPAGIKFHYTRIKSTVTNWRTVLQNIFGLDYTGGGTEAIMIIYYSPKLGHEDSAMYFGDVYMRLSLMLN